MKLGKLFALSLALGSLLSGCGSSDQDSQTKFNVLANPHLIGKVKDGTLTIDVGGANLPAKGAARDALDADIRRAVAKWVEPLAIFGHDPNPSVNITHCSDPDEKNNLACLKLPFFSFFKPDLRFYIEKDIRSYYTNGTIHLDPKGGFDTILHEMGHAFGLGDTYAEGGWFCDIHHGKFAPSSTSVMCNADFSDLQTDDIAGIQHLYCQKFPSDCSFRVLTVEKFTDRRGNDYKNFSLDKADYMGCYTACADDLKCKAFTYVGPGVQGDKARCWLKDKVPAKDSVKGFVSGIKDAEGFVSVEMNTDRPGKDYKNTKLSKEDYELCRKSCTQDNSCKSFTYVPANVQGPEARCWLKNAVAAKSELGSMISGTRR